MGNLYLESLDAIGNDGVFTQRRRFSGLYMDQFMRVCFVALTHPSGLNINLLISNAVGEEFVPAMIIFDFLLSPSNYAL